MTAFLHFLAWEWLNVALEYSATAWVRLPHWFAAVVAVNLATHPALTFFLDRFGCAPSILFPAEGAVSMVEAVILMILYRRHARPASLAGMAMLMNAASLATGLALSI